MAVIGEPLDPYVVQQIKVRQKLHGSFNRTPDEISILNSNTSFLKLASATSVSKDRLKEIGVSENLEGYELAQKFILSSGISEIKKNSSGSPQLFQRGGFNPQGTGQDSSYTAGQFGYSPMPGLISADIKNLNRGSIKKATVKLVAHNVEQFQIIDLLYLRLGYTVLLEWGNSTYPTNPINQSDPVSKGIIGSTIIEKDFYSNRDFNKILKKIAAAREFYDGNYDGFIAKVSNFQWDFKEDGSYDITLTLISLGDVIESLKSNLSPDAATRDFINLTAGQINNTPPSDEGNDGDNADPIENNRLSSIIHSMLYIWKYIREVNGKASDYLRVNNETSIGWSQLLENELKNNQNQNNNNGSITLSATSYDIIIPYRLEYKTIGDDDGQMNWVNSTLWPVLSTPAFFNDKQMFTNKVGQFDFNTYTGFGSTGVKGIPMIKWNFYKTKGQWVGYFNLYRYQYFKNAVTIPNDGTVNADSVLKKYIDVKAWEIAKNFLPTSEGGKGLVGYGFYQSSGNYNFPKYTPLRGKFPQYEDINDVKNLKTTGDPKEYLNNGDPRESSQLNGGAWGKGLQTEYYTNNLKRSANVYAAIPDENQGSVKFTPRPYSDYKGNTRGPSNFGELDFDEGGVFSITIPTSITLSSESFTKHAIPGFEVRNYFPGIDSFSKFKKLWIKESKLDSSGNPQSNSTVNGGTTTITIDNPLKDAGKYDAFVIGSKTPQYYLRLGFLLEYLKKNILPRVKLSDTHDDNPPIFDIDFNVFQSICFSPPNQISFDPTICLVKNFNFLGIEVLKDILPYRLSDTFSSEISRFPKCNPDYAGATMNTYLNFEFIIKSLSEDENGNVSVFQFIKNLCTGINKAMGGVNNLEPIIDEDNNILRIIDTTPIPGTIRNNKSRNDYKLQIYGYDGSNASSNFIRKFNLKTAITPQFATMVTVGATAGGYTKGVEATAFSSWNTGLVDKYKKEFTPGNKKTAENAKEDVSQEDEAISSFKKNFENLSPDNIGKRYGFKKVTEDDGKTIFREIDESIIKSNLAVATEYFKYTLAKKSGNNSGGMIGFIPFKLNFEMDGMSGIKIYNKLTIDTRVLPKAYQSQLDLVVTGVSHKISNQDWVTSIETTVIPNSNPEKPKITFTPTNPTVGTTSGGTVGATGAKSIPTDPNKKCGKAAGNHCTDSSIHVDTVYPKTTFFGGPSSPKIAVSKLNLPTKLVTKSSLPEVAKQWTKLSKKDFVKKAKSVINLVCPRASKEEKNEVLTALYAKCSVEQPPWSIGGPGNNYFGIEGSSWKVYSEDLGKMQRMRASEGGTGISKFYWSFDTVEIGMKIAVSIIASRSMHGAVGDSLEDRANEYAWRYFRDWNGYGGRKLPTWKGDDCNPIRTSSNAYKTAVNEIKANGGLF